MGQIVACKTVFETDASLASLFYILRVCVTWLTKPTMAGLQGKVALVSGGAKGQSIFKRHFAT